MTQEDQQTIVDELDGEFQTGFEGVEAQPFLAQLPRCSVEVTVENAYLGKSSQKGRNQLMAVCIINSCSEEGEYIGKKYTKTWGLAGDQNLAWLKRDMLALDIVPPKNPKDLLRVCNELMGVRFAANLVPNKEDPDQYPPNMFINRGARIVGDSSTDGDIPF